MIDPSNPMPYVNAVIVGVYTAVTLHVRWPWGWSGRRRDVTLKRRKRWYE